MDNKKDVNILRKKEEIEHLIGDKIDRAVTQKNQRLFARKIKKQ
jgi:hypothetical protein